MFLPLFRILYTGILLGIWTRPGTSIIFISFILVNQTLIYVALWLQRNSRWVSNLIGTCTNIQQYHKTFCSIEHRQLLLCSSVFDFQISFELGRGKQHTSTTNIFFSCFSSKHAVLKSTTLARNQDTVSKQGYMSSHRLLFQ